MSFCFIKVLLKNKFLNRSLTKNFYVKFHFLIFILKEPNIKKHSKALKNYARSYTVEVLNSKGLTNQLDITKPHVKNLLEELLAEMRSFKY